jgi:hypothetical protein
MVYIIQKYKYKNAKHQDAQEKFFAAGWRNKIAPARENIYENP